MKDSGVDWIGDVPAHWEKLAQKHIFQLKKALVGKRSSNYDLLSLTLRGIIKRDMENPGGKFPAEFDTYQEVSPGDFVFCHFDVEETPRTVGLSDHAGMITGAYTVYLPNKNCDPRYLLHFQIFADTDKKFRGLYKGLRNTISKDVFGSFKMPIPPLNEQAQIVSYIDNESAKIDAVIGIKQSQIGVLSEYKTTLIDRAVTGKIKVA
jgi:type I restriction enzyme, S subunit